MGGDTTGKTSAAVAVAATEDECEVTNTGFDSFARRLLR